MRRTALVVSLLLAACGSPVAPSQHGDLELARDHVRRERHHHGDPPDTPPEPPASPGPPSGVLGVGYSTTHGIIEGAAYYGSRITNAGFSACGVDYWADPESECWKNLRKLDANPRYVWLQASIRTRDTTGMTALCQTSVRLLHEAYPNATRIYVSGSVYLGWEGYEPYGRQTWDVAERCVGGLPYAGRGPWLWDDSWPESYYGRHGSHLSTEGARAAGFIVWRFDWEFGA